MPEGRARALGLDAGGILGGDPARVLRRCRRLDRTPRPAPPRRPAQRRGDRDPGGHEAKVSGLNRLGASLLDAFEGATRRGESLSDVLKGLALDLARLAAERGADSILDGLLGGAGGGGGGGGIGGGAVSGGRAAFAGTSIPGGIGGFAKGGAFAGGRSIAAFAFADGLGIMGEAGPETILPPAMIVATAA